MDQTEILLTAETYALQGWDFAKGWLLSPAAWTQFGLLVVAYVVAVYITRKLLPLLSKYLAPPADQDNVLAKIRRFILMFTPLLLPLMAYAFTGLGEGVTRSIFGSGEVIAFGKRVFMFLAARILVREVLQDPMLKVLGRYLLLPIAALYAVGLLDEVMAQLDQTVLPLGNLSFSLLFLLRFIVVGGAIFWLGRWSNEQSSSFIKNQQEMRPAMRELAAKATEIAIFGLAFLLVMNIMRSSLTSSAVLTGVIVVGLGCVLQNTASNLISGGILLL